jgi:hypothetical protein
MFEDTKAVIRSRQWKTDRQYNVQNKRDIMRDNGLQNTIQKTRDKT